MLFLFFSEMQGLNEEILANIHVIDAHVKTHKLPELYRACDCFVLPSRGEGTWQDFIPFHSCCSFLDFFVLLALTFLIPYNVGWGRPHVEAMSMGLPIIATNWSGPTEYMTEENSFPLRIEEDLVQVGGSGKFHCRRSIPPFLIH